jgi:hypothetical protein
MTLLDILLEYHILYLKLKHSSFFESIYLIHADSLVNHHYARVCKGKPEVSTTDVCIGTP